MRELTVQQIITAFLAIGVRLSGLMLFAPFFGSQSIPPRIKAGLVIGVSALFFPLLYPMLIHMDLSSWPAFVFGELLVGAALGIATNLVFDAVQMAGQVVSTQMGFSLINILDPQTQVDSTVMSVFYQTIAMLIFLRLDVHMWLLRAVGRSFALLPPGSIHLSGAFALTAVRAGGVVFALGVQMAAPVLSATFLMDIVLGLLGKASPQAPLMLLGTPLKTLLALSILFLALKYWPAMLSRFFQSSMELSDRLLVLAR
jgi:flagellar biosynthesis protein FliR